MPEETERLTNQWYIDRRIATPDGEYPLSEARFASIHEWQLAQKEREDV